MFESVPFPPNQPEANAGAPIPALIEGVVPIPPVLRLRSKSALEGLYTREKFSAREISRLAGASRSGVLKALDRFSIPRETCASFFHWASPPSYFATRLTAKPIRT